MPKSDTSKKVILSVWWGINGIIYWELLPSDTTITANIYCDQLDKVAARLTKNQNDVYFLHDNARPLVSKATREKLLSLGWAVLPHPLYSPDIMPLDYHLFRFLALYLANKKLKNEDQLKSDLTTFFDQKPKNFYEEGIMSLQTR